MTQQRTGLGTALPNQQPEGNEIVDRKKDLAMDINRAPQLARFIHNVNCMVFESSPRVAHNKVEIYWKQAVFASCTDNFVHTLSEIHSHPHRRVQKENCPQHFARFNHRNGKESSNAVNEFSWNIFSITFFVMFFGILEVFPEFSYLHHITLGYSWSAAKMTSLRYAHRQLMGHKQCSDVYQAALPSTPVIAVYALLFRTAEWGLWTATAHW